MERCFSETDWEPTLPPNIHTKIYSSTYTVHTYYTEVRTYMLAYIHTFSYTHIQFSRNKQDILGQPVCHKQEFDISEQFPTRYCSTWLRSLLCYIKKFVIEEFFIRVFHCTYLYTHLDIRTYVHTVLQHTHTLTYIYIQYFKVRTRTSTNTRTHSHLYIYVLYMLYIQCMHMYIP